MNHFEAVQQYAREVPLSASIARSFERVSDLAPAIRREAETIPAREVRVPSNHCEERQQRYEALRCAVRKVVNDTGTKRLRNTNMRARSPSCTGMGRGMQAYSHTLEEVS